MRDGDKLVVMGRVAAPFGVKGWVKIQPFTEYVDSLLDYDVWWLGRNGQFKEVELLEAQPHNKTLVARLEGVEDRDQAAALQGQEVAVPRAELPETDADEYYWNDLIGLQVKNLQGDDLGVVDHLMETGANDVLVVVKGERERLIPFVSQVVKTVDLGAGRIEVDWDKDF
jgi:16S rRNA processing protein RimM